MTPCSPSQYGAFPRIYPRPDYGPAWPIVRDTLVTLVRWPTISAAFSTLCLPLYGLAYEWFEKNVFPIVERLPLPNYVQPEDFFFAFGLSVSIAAIYTIENSFFYFCDKYKLLQQYKLPRLPAQEPSVELRETAFYKQLFAHVVIAPLLMVFAVGPLCRSINSNASSTQHLPNFHEMWYCFFVCFVVNEIMFYYGHRLMHVPFFYKNFHKDHHAFVGTTSLAAEHFHDVDTALNAYLPYLVGIFLTKAHFYFVFCWFFCRLTEAYESHSGYCFEGSLAQKMGFTYHTRTAHHDYHHTSNSGNFGLEFLDWIHGTMDSYASAGGMHGYITKSKAAKVE